MTTETSCPLCEQPATLAKVPDHDAYAVQCNRCIGFTITGPLMAIFELARAKKHTSILDRLVDLSDRAAATQAEGGNLNLTTDTWTAHAFAQREKRLRKS